ncbi:MAG: histidine kinase dimerization/phosphoacceptor domain -containing protein [Bacteroidia bacterium]
MTNRVIVGTDELNKIHLLSLVASETDNAVLIFDRDLNLEYVNAGFTKMTGYNMDEITLIKGRSLFNITYNDNFPQIFDDAIVERTSKVYESSMKHKDGHELWTSSTLTPVFDEQGDLKNVVVIDTDITERMRMERQLQESLEERGLLLKEIHHRVKNNLQIIISLFNLQSSYISDESALKALKDGQHRIKSMALIHERFYQSEGLSKIDFDDYIKRLTENLFLSYNINQEKIKFKIDSVKVPLDIDTAVPCGLIVNELVSNSLNHAFVGRETGEIFISFHPLGESHCRLIIADNGVGFKEGFVFENSDSLGTQLVTALTEQIDGRVAYENNNNGLKYTIDFKRV